MNNDKKNQYLFSINSFYSMVELYNLDNNDYYIWNFNDFFVLMKMIIIFHMNIHYMN